MNEETSLQILQTLKIIKEYCLLLHAYKFKNLNEMDMFLERQDLIKLIQEETENLNIPV